MHIFTKYFSALLTFIIHSSSLLKEGEKTSKLAKVLVEAILDVYLYLHPNYVLSDIVFSWSHVYMPDRVSIFF